MAMDENLWREKGPKALLEYLRTATGEDHDAVVYDTKLEFDPSNSDALHYIACVAMEKSYRVITPDNGQKGCGVSPAQKLSDGSVAAYDSDEGNETVRRLRAERIYREEHATGPCIYVPDAGKYCSALWGALHWRYIPYDEMTASEQRKENLRKISDALWLAFWYWIPGRIFFIAMLVWGAISLLGLLSHV